MKHAQLWRRILNNGLQDAGEYFGWSPKFDGVDEIVGSILSAPLISFQVQCLVPRPDDTMLWDDFRGHAIAPPFPTFWMETTCCDYCGPTGVLVISAKRDDVFDLTFLAVCAYSHVLDYFEPKPLVHSSVRLSYRNEILETPTVNTFMPSEQLPKEGELWLYNFARRGSMQALCALTSQRIRALRIPGHT